MKLVVDLCGTLITENTTHAFLRWLSLRGAARFYSGVGLSPAVSLLDSKTGWNIARRLQVFSTQGMSRALLYEEGLEYVRNRLKTHVNARVLGDIREAQRRSVPVYLATSTLDPIADAVFKELELTNMVCSQLEFDSSGICTGRLALDLLGKKWRALSRLVSDEDRELVVYTDNPEDTDLMEQASHVFYVGKRESVRVQSVSNFTFI